MDADLIILTCGGTFDKQYGTGLGVRDLSFGSEPAITTILRKVHAYADFPIVRLMAKDSLDMTARDRATVAAMCASVPHKHILITHGTDTAKKTAKSISKKRLVGKTVVITAAGQPAVMQGTDADFNAGFALMAALLAPPGVWIAMNATLYRWNECEKDSSGVFVPTKIRGGVR